MEMLVLCLERAGIAAWFTAEHSVCCTAGASTCLPATSYTPLALSITGMSRRARQTFLLMRTGMATSFLMLPQGCLYPVSCCLLLLVGICRNSLKLANEHELKTVAFPAISCGVYGYPPEDAVEVIAPRLLVLAYKLIKDLSMQCAGQAAHLSVSTQKHQRLKLDSAVHRGPFQNSIRMIAVLQALEPLMVLQECCCGQ